MFIYNYLLQYLTSIKRNNYEIKKLKNYFKEQSRIESGIQLYTFNLFRMQKTKWSVKLNEPEITSNKVFTNEM